jgi:hypothetical protein
VNHRGFGPAWTNSLFENNAELCLGMYLSVKQRRALLKEKVEALAQTGSDSLKSACQQWLDTFDDIDKSRQSTDLLIDELQKAGGEKSY